VPDDIGGHSFEQLQVGISIQQIGKSPAKSPQILPHPVGQPLIYLPADGLRIVMVVAAGTQAQRGLGGGKLRLVEGWGSLTEGEVSQQTEYSQLHLTAKRLFRHIFRQARKLLRREAGQHARQIPDLLLSLGEEKASQKIGLGGGHTG